MKVKELRQKLAEFGQKNKEHFDRSYKKGMAKDDSSPPNIKLSKENFDHLEIDTKPSSASTSPSSSCDSDLSPQNASTANILLGPFLNKNIPTSYSFESSECSDSSGWSDVKAPPTIFSGDNLEHVMGKDHLELLEKQAPIVLTSKSFANVETVDSFDEDPFPEMPTGSMHNSTLLKGALLTKSTLDALCEIPTTQEDEDDEMPALQPCSSSTGASIHTTELSLSEDIDSMRSMKSVSSKGSDTASISPGAMVSKMGNLFLSDPKEETPMPQPVVARRKTIHPEDLPFLKSSAPTMTAPLPEPTVARRKTINPEDLPFLKPSLPTSDPNKALNEITPKPRNTPVGHGIRKFGGPRKTIVESRKEQLSQKWAENKSVLLVKKVQWDVCKRTGAYKKKIVVEKEIKEEAGST